MSTTLPHDDQDVRTQRHLECLDTLIAQGMDLAARLYQQSTTPSDLCSALAEPGTAVPFITPDVIASFAQINLTVRRAILVSRKLTEPLPSARRPGILKAEDPVYRGAEPTQAEPVRTEFADRLHSPDLEDRIGNRPVHEIIAGLARDLGDTRGIGYDTSRAPEDVDKQDAHALQPAIPRTPPDHIPPGGRKPPAAPLANPYAKPDPRPPKR